MSLISRRQLGRLSFASGMGLAACSSQSKRQVEPSTDHSAEEYVWVSANASLPLFAAHDHVGLQMVAKELGVRTTIAGPSTVDIPGMVGVLDQVAARRPAGIMVVGWDPSALIQPINAAIAAGVPVVCVDADVPLSKRLAFVGTDWFDIGVRQAQAMLTAAAGRGGKVAMLGLLEQEVDQRAFAGFRSVLVGSRLVCMDPVSDKGSIAEAARVATGLLQAHPDIVGLAGFDSESGPGIGQAIKEAGRSGQIIGTCVEAEEAHLRYIKDGSLTALVAQKRALFTYYGVKLLYDAVHSPLRRLFPSENGQPVHLPNVIHTGSFVVTRENLEAFVRGV
jgi:ribose transport system substrate-binding protein